MGVNLACLHNGFGRCLLGQVVWVGRSSMEVLLELSTAGKKQVVAEPGLAAGGEQQDGCQGDSNSSWEGEAKEALSR